MALNWTNSQNTCKIWQFLICLWQKGDRTLSTNPMSLITLDNITWLASFLNVLAMALQFWKLVKKWDATGVSVGMLTIFCFVQGTYMMVGYRSHQWALFWGMIFSLLLTAASACVSFYLQHIKPRKEAEEKRDIWEARDRLYKNRSIW